MKVECVHCGASGQMDETRIPPGVKTIICPRCKMSSPLPVIGQTPEPPQFADAFQQMASSSPPLPPPARIEAAAAVTPPSPSPSLTTVSALPTQPEVKTVTAVCTVCADTFPRNEMVRFGATWVCAACKPSYVQMLAQGKPRPGEMRYAGFNVRFGAKFLDGLILWVVGSFISIAIGFVLPKSSPEVAIAVTGLTFILQISVAAAYSGYFLGKNQATPGKMACGLIVVSPDGGQITVSRGVGRYFAEMLSSITLSIGYLMVLFDAEKRSLHDRICNTRVIYK